MRNNWASCSSNGNLTFNIELLELDDELLHFYVPNHGRLWKSLMTVYLGDYRDLERRLEIATSISVEV